MGERRTSYRGSFLEVVTEDVELPNGTRVELDLVGRELPSGVTESASTCCAA